MVVWVGDWVIGLIVVILGNIGMNNYIPFVGLNNLFKSPSNHSMSNQKYTPEENDFSAEQLDTYEYTRGIGAYKPHFAGVPENYYPLNCKEITVAALILVFTIGAVLGIMIGFLFWVQAGGLEGYVIAWVAVLLTFIVIAIILFYFGGKARRRMEKELIAENNRKQQEMIHGKKNTTAGM